MLFDDAIKKLIIPNLEINEALTYLPHLNGVARKSK